MPCSVQMSVNTVLIDYSLAKDVIVNDARTPALTDGR